MLVVHNTMSKSKEEFKPLKDNEVKMFVCGQTVYDDAHLGHAKNYINFDVIARWLRRSGYRLKYIQNITDVDDKIIKRAAEEGIEPKELARNYENRFMEDMRAIGVTESIDSYPRSHDFIEQITEQIQVLIDKGFAYQMDEDIYYNVSKFKDYTNLSRMDIKELEKHRIEPKPGKINSYDFALWKGAKPGEPSWRIKLKIKGKPIEIEGRPGWHIEDTAITKSIFGSQYDIHGGAIELIFPHHTNEIAQAEAAFGVKPFVKYWLHSGIMLIRGEKMSKSLKNFVRIRDLLRKYSPEALRLLVCSTHYRKDIAYTEDLMKASESRLRYLYSSFSIFYNMGASESSESREEIIRIADELRIDFKKAMDDDFNTPLALSKLISAIDKLRSFAELNPDANKEAKDFAVNEVLSHARIFGILEKDIYKEKLPEEAQTLIKKRESFRSKKEFEKADSIRERLKSEFGIIVEDSEYGTIWYK